MRWSLIVLSTVFLALVFVSPAHAEIEELTIGVDGLSCPFCVMGLEKNLKKVESVDSVKVHLKKAQANVGLRAGAEFNLKSLKNAVKEAGFSWRGARIKVTGAVVREEGFLAIESKGDKTRFVLYDQNHVDAESDSSTPEVLNISLKERLIKVEDGKLVVIQGVIHQHANMKPGLLVEEVETNP